MCLEENGHIKCIVSATKNNPLKLGYSEVSFPSIFFICSIIHNKITLRQVYILLTHFYLWFEIFESSLLTCFGLFWVLVCFDIARALSILRAELTLDLLPESPWSNYVFIINNCSFFLNAVHLSQIWPRLNNHKIL